VEHRGGDESRQVRAGQQHDAERLADVVATEDPATGGALQERFRRDRREHQKRQRVPAPRRSIRVRGASRVQQVQRQEPVRDAREPAVARPAFVKEPHPEGDGRRQDQVLQQGLAAAEATLSPEEERDEQGEVVDEVQEAAMDRVSGERPPGLDC